MKKTMFPLVATMILLVSCKKGVTDSELNKLPEPAKNQTTLDEKALEDLKTPYILEELSPKTNEATIGGTNYANLFEDHFNSRTLNTAVWNTVRNEKKKSGEYNIVWNNNGASDYELTGSQLKLKITKSGSGGKILSCGRVDTKTIKSFKYGYFEARIKFPSPAGYWGAFWSMPNQDNGGMTVPPPPNKTKNDTIHDNNVGTDGAEIDIVEANQPRSYSYGMHIDGYGEGVTNAWSATHGPSSSMYNGYHI